MISVRSLLELACILLMLIRRNGTNVHRNLSARIGAKHLQRGSVCFKATGGRQAWAVLHHPACEP